MASVGWILALTGYIANEVQSAATVADTNTLFAWLPAIVLLVIFLILKFVYQTVKTSSSKSF